MPIRAAFGRTRYRSSANILTELAVTLGATGLNDAYHPVLSRAAPPYFVVVCWIGDDVALILAQTSSLCCLISE